MLIDKLDSYSYNFICDILSSTNSIYVNEKINKIKKYYISLFPNNKKEIEKIPIYEYNKGLPIGNYTSQMFANIYLNEMDQYIKHQLHCKYVFRYMDDAVILLKTKEEAKDALEKITIFLRDKLELELNSKTQIFKNTQGVNFCGYKINEYRIKIRDKGKKKLKKKIKKLKYMIVNMYQLQKESLY